MDISKYVRKYLKTVVFKDIDEISGATEIVLSDDNIPIYLKQGWLSLAGHRLDLSGIPEIYYPQVMEKIQKNYPSKSQILALYKPGFHITEHDDSYVIEIGNTFEVSQYIYDIPYDLVLKVCITYFSEEGTTGIWIQCSPKDEKLSLNRTTYQVEGQVQVPNHKVKAEIIVYLGDRNPSKTIIEDEEFPTDLEDSIKPRRNRIGTVYQYRFKQWMSYGIHITMFK